MYGNEGDEDLGSSNESELDVRAASKVVYDVDSDDGSPGLSVERGRTRDWVPIKPSPISSRTRARINHDGLTA